MTVLIFPSTLESAVTFASECRRWQERTVGASSDESQPNADQFDVSAHLPFISDPSFFGALGELVEKHGIRRIFTSHAPIFHFLQKELETHFPELTLMGDGPFKSQMNSVNYWFGQAQKNMAAVSRYANQEPAFDANFLAGILAKADTIHGECSREKIFALCGIVPFSPKGDVVEIGCLYGKSSFVLNRLAARAGIGTTLCVDPWDLGLSIQHDAPLNIQEASEGWDWDVVYRGFLINMLGSGAPELNYMRATSADAFFSYCDASSVHSPEFGTTPLAGSISVLHLDGNHDESAVEEDFRLWSQRLLPNSWIIFDDYTWPHGDGPRKVADRTLEFYGSRIHRHFVAGGAMFMNISE